MKEIAVEFCRVTKIHELVLQTPLKKSFFSKKQKYQFMSLSNVSFKVGKGEIVGILGLNGSGKSTLSNLIADVTNPTKGKINRRGTVSLLAINSGLKPSLTGEENIRLKCLFHGLKEKEIDSLQQQIIEFSELGKFIHQPIKSYSSGMKAKLGFSIAIHMSPDVLIIDEALAVGDQTFYHKCINRIQLFKEQGKTIFFVSHSLPQVKQLCHKAIWLDQGEVIETGEAIQVCQNYGAFIKEINDLSPEAKKQRQEEAAEKRIVASEVLTKRKIKIRWYTYVYIVILFVGLAVSLYLL